MNKFQKLLSFKRSSKFGSNYFGAKSIKKDQDIDLVKLTVSEYEIMLFDLKNFYKKEKGVRKDGRKAFEFHKLSAEQGNINAKFQLGYCYDEGIGTEINKVKAFELYK